MGPSLAVHRLRLWDPACPEARKTNRFPACASLMPTDCAVCVGSAPDHGKARCSCARRARCAPEILMTFPCIMAVSYFFNDYKTLNPLFAHRSHRRANLAHGPWWGLLLRDRRLFQAPCATTTHHGGARWPRQPEQPPVCERMGFSPVPTRSSLTQKFTISCQCHTQWKILRKNERSRWDLSDGRFNLETEELTPLFQKNT